MLNMSCAKVKILLILKISFSSTKAQQIFKFYAEQYDQFIYMR